MVLLSGVQRTLGEKWGVQQVSEKASDLRDYMLAALLRTRALDPLGSSLHSCKMTLLFAWETGCLINEMQV